MGLNRMQRAPDPIGLAMQTLINRANWATESSRPRFMKDEAAILLRSRTSGYAIQYSPP